LISVGFALETGDGREQARRKLAEKNLDLIVLNDASAPDAGLEVDTNRVLLFDRQGGSQEVPLLPKTEVAEIILDRIAPLVGRAR
jgi:phosphopantothenoylcysteine decarboxylase/phosphopantothenate--cysteine ligase